MERDAERTGALSLDTPLSIEVDRVAAAFASWYELFPRSWGGLKEVEKQIPAIAELGFDVLYFPPIHPIGTKARKGRNNTLTAGPDDPGSPYAIGAQEGGHDAVHPELGTMDDVRALCATAREHGMDVALDLALNSSPDHPWLKRAPGVVPAAPRRHAQVRREPAQALPGHLQLQLGHARLARAVAGDGATSSSTGSTPACKFFRVDNPHTKPFPFWEWLIARGPRRRPLGRLPRRGLHPPRGDAPAGEDRLHPVLHVLHLEELPLGAHRVRQRARPRAGARVLPAELLHQHAGHPARVPPARRAAGVPSRLVLAGTLSPTYGIYSGYEQFENEPVRPGSEEYLDSEKYEIRQRALDGPLLPMVRRMNEIRRENPALQRLDERHASSSPTTRPSSPTSSRRPATR